MCFRNDDVQTDYTCNDPTDKIVQKSWDRLSGTYWSDRVLGDKKPNEESEIDNICCGSRRYCSGNSDKSLDIECTVALGNTGEYRSNSDNIEILDTDDTSDISSMAVKCCDIEDVITLETTSEIPEGDNNQLIERFTNMYTVEGFNNTRPNVQQDCRIIKSELISELKVNENQVVIDCKLNKQGEKYLIKVYFISNKENPLPEGLQEKLKKGVKIERLGITVKPTVSGLEDIDVEEGLGNKKMIIILISLIIAGIIGGIYLMNK